MKKLLTLLLILSVATIANANLIPNNGDFGGATGFAVATGWTTAWNGGTWADTGQNAYKAWGDGAQWGTGGANVQNIEMYAGTTVGYSIDILDPSIELMAGATASLVLTFIDVSNNNLNGTWGTAYALVASGALTADTWTTFSGTVAAPLGTTHMSYQIQFQGTSVLGGGGAIWFDNAVLTPEPMTVALLGLGGLFLRRRK